jgi:hypothetical protein
MNGFYMVAIEDHCPRKKAIDSLCSQEICDRKTRKLKLTVFPNKVSPTGSPSFLWFTAICISFCKNNVILEREKYKIFRQGSGRET